MRTLPDMWWLLVEAVQFYQESEFAIANAIEESMAALFQRNYLTCSVAQRVRVCMRACVCARA